MSTNAWLRAQRKGELQDLAIALGLDVSQPLKKSDLEALIETHVLSNDASLVDNDRLIGFWNSRARSAGSPVKREPVDVSEPKPPSTALRRRTTRALDELSNESLDQDSASPLALLPRTPARALALASSRLHLPSTPASVQRAVDRSVELFQDGVVAVQDSTLAEATVTTRSTLSTVPNILLSIAVFEAYFLRPAVLPDALWLTTPAVPALYLPAIPIVLPNLTTMLSASFWGPVFAWLATTVFVPLVFAYFYNLSANAASKRLRNKYLFDPLSFSIAKAVLSFAVFAQGVSFSGLVHQTAIARVNAAVYGGWQGLLVGAGISGLAAFYEAILSK
ncbi:hypothetical protein Cpir12675_005494 [Ceratocystis pirilliformis]|uniref:Uncharacterized protein n=1 Tax=Ceratocystis pirilliformis TaxID=259994 RepID=A0ABR3YQN7_9PEZI